MKATTLATARQYSYTGDGQGVPGLPHDITDVEAAQAGVSDLLQAAIDNGNYTEVRNGGDTSIQ